MQKLPFYHFAYSPRDILIAGVLSHQRKIKIAGPSLFDLHPDSRVARAISLIAPRISLHDVEPNPWIMGGRTLETDRGC